MDSEGVGRFSDRLIKGVGDLIELLSRGVGETGYLLGEVDGVCYGLLGSSCGEHDRALRQFVDREVEFILSAVLPDEVLFPVCEEAFYYFQERFIFVPKILEPFRSLSTGQSKTRLLVHNSAEESNSAYSMSKVLKVYDCREQVRVVDLAEESVRWDDFEGVNECRYDLGASSHSDVLMIRCMSKQVGCPCFAWGNREDGVRISPFRFLAYGLSFSESSVSGGRLSLRKVLGSRAAPVVSDAQERSGNSYHWSFEAVLEDVMDSLGVRIGKVEEGSCCDFRYPNRFLRSIYSANLESSAWYIGDCVESWAQLPRTMCRYLNHSSQVLYYHHLYQKEKALEGAGSEDEDLADVCDCFRGDFVTLVFELSGRLPGNRMFHYCMEQYNWWLDACLKRAQSRNDLEPTYKNGYSEIALNILNGFSSVCDPGRRSYLLDLSLDLFGRDRSNGRLTPDCGRFEFLVHYYRFGIGARLTEEVQRMYRECVEYSDLYVLAAAQCAAGGDFEGASECCACEIDHGKFEDAGVRMALHVFARALDFGRLGKLYGAFIKGEWGVDRSAGGQLVLDGLGARVFKEMLRSRSRFVEASVVESCIEFVGSIESSGIGSTVFPYDKAFFLMAGGDDDGALGAVEALSVQSLGMCTRLAVSAWAQGKRGLSGALLDLEGEASRLISSDLVRYASLSLILGKTGAAADAFQLVLLKYPFVFSFASRDTFQWLLLSAVAHAVGDSQLEARCLEIFSRVDKQEVVVEGLVESCCVVDDERCRRLVSSIRIAD